MIRRAWHWDWKGSRRELAYTGLVTDGGIKAGQEEVGGLLKAFQGGQELK